MISVIVERAPGDKQGPDISDPLITSPLVAVERGRNEIDAKCSSREPITSTGPYNGFIRPGSMNEVADSEQQVWRGMVKSCAVVINRNGDTYTADTNLTIERVAQ